MHKRFDLDGKVAVVIGGAGGIGKALSLGMSQHGAKLVIASRNIEAIKAAADEIKAETGGEIFCHTVDATSEESMGELVKATLDQFGQVDVLINAMGLNIKHPGYEYNMEDWDTLFEVNVKGTMIACKAFGKVMKEAGGGNIINLSSVRGIRGYGGGNAGYAATKGAVSLITKCLAIEMAQDNIRVNALGPALVITPGTVHIKKDPKLAAKYAAIIPLGRIAEPEDLIGATVFLASDAAGFVTGQTIYVDGGLTAS